MNISQLIPGVNTSVPPVRVQTHLNKAGAVSYTRSLQEQIVQILTTGTLQNTFYASAQELGAEAVKLLFKAREECPDFLARALVYARNKGFMRSLPILGLVVLSGGRGKTKHLFQSIFSRVILTPDDLRAFTDLCRSGKVSRRKALGGMNRAAVREYLSTISEYHTIKYGSAVSRGITLRDLVKMSHAKGSSDPVRERLSWLIQGRKGLGANPNLNSRIRSLEDLKRAATEDAQTKLIAEGGLPFEVVIPSLKSTTPAIWTELLKNAPYMNLLKNIVTFHCHDVFKSEDNVRIAVEKLTNPAAVERSKVFPFRFFDAWRQYIAVENSNSQIADAMRTAMELSFCNVPTLGGRTVAIGADVSGSMSSVIPGNQSERTFIDIAGIFTGALLRRIEDRAIPLPFDTAVHPNLGLSKHDDMIATAMKLRRVSGGGTAVSAPIQYLLDYKIRTDVFIGITDNEEWAYGGYGYYAEGNFLDLWRRYRKEINPEAQAFLLTISPTRDAVAPAGEKGVRFIYGWNANVLNYISLALEGGASQVQEIERMQLQSIANPNGFPAEDDQDAQTDID